MRDFVSVFDVVDANIAAIDRGDGAEMNIASGEATSVNRVFEVLKSVTGYRWNALHGPGRPGDVYRISLDCSRASAELGWKPRTGLEAGLAETVEFFRGPNTIGRDRKPGPLGGLDTVDTDYDAIILGAGAAGLAAGLYTTRAMMKTLLIEQLGPGGQLLITDEIDNYPGFPEGVKGQELAMMMEATDHPVRR